jgi:hypothetical protein
LHFPSSRVPSVARIRYEEIAADPGNRECTSVDCRIAQVEQVDEVRARGGVM